MKTVSYIAARAFGIGRTGRRAEVPECGLPFVPGGSIGEFVSASRDCQTYFNTSPPGPESGELLDGVCLGRGVVMVVDQFPMPFPEAAGPTGFQDRPAADSLGQPIPTGFNIGRLFAACDCATDEYRIALDISAPPELDWMGGGAEDAIDADFEFPPCLTPEVRDDRGPCPSDFDVCTIERCESGECTSAPVCFGDVDGSGSSTDIDDILCVLAGFADFAACPNGDIAPDCQGDGVIELSDPLAILGSFAGDDECECGIAGFQNAVTNSNRDYSPVNGLVPDEFKLLRPPRGQNWSRYPQ